MNRYDHLPPEQRRTQRLVDQFNADARLWEKLAPRRRLRRQIRPKRSRKALQAAALREFARARPPADCVGTWEGA